VIIVKGPSFEVQLNSLRLHFESKVRFENVVVTKELSIVMMFLWCWVVAQWQKNGQIFRNVHALLQPMWLKTLPLQKFTKSDNFRTVIFVPQQNINQHGSFFKNLGSGLPCVPPTAILAALLTCSPCLAFKFHVLAADSPLKVDAVGWIA